MKLFQKQNHVYFGLSLLLWLGSYPLIGYSGLGTAHFNANQSSILSLLITGWPIFIIPIIPLIATFYWGEKIMKRKYLLLFSLGIFLLLLVYLVIDLYQVVQYRGEGAAGAFIAAGFDSYIIEYLLIQVGFVLLFFILQKKFSAWKFSKVATISFIIYLIAATLFFSHSYIRSLAFDRHFCSEEVEAKGFYSRLFFLEPITKQELQQLTKENDLTIRFIVLAKKENKADYHTFDFNGSFYSYFNKETMDKPLSELLKPTSERSSNTMQKEYQQDMKEFAPLIQAYEGNEPIVWFVDVDKTPMPKMTKLAKELDNQHRLGIYEEKSLHYYGGYNPEKIIPQTPERKVDQARCYKYL